MLDLGRVDKVLFFTSSPGLGKDYADIAETRRFEDAELYAACKEREDEAVSGATLDHVVILVRVKADFA